MTNRGAKHGDWICFECVEERALKSRTYTHTIHHGHCDYCERKVNVTAARDFGYPPLEET